MKMLLNNYLNHYGVNDMIKKGLNTRFAEIGKIKIGGVGEKKIGKSGNEYRVPVRFSHFVVTTTEKSTEGNFIPNQKLMDALEQKYGTPLKEIPIRLPFDSIDMNFFTSFQYYHGKKCLCHGDGETATRLEKDKAGEYTIETSIKCDPDTCQILKEEKCKVSGILSCYITDTMEVGGVYRFRTHSWNSVSNILAALKYFAENTRGILQGLPLKLLFLKKSTQDHGNVSVVTVVLDGIEMLKMKQLALSELENRVKLGVDMKALELKAKDEGFAVDNDDPGDVQDEFYGDEEPPNVEPEKGVTSESAAEKLKSAEHAKPEPKSAPDQGSLL